MAYFRLNVRYIEFRQSADDGQLPAVGQIVVHMNHRPGTSTTDDDDDDDVNFVST